MVNRDHWFSGMFPYQIYYRFVLKLVKDAIATQNDEVMILLDFECFYLRHSYDNSGNAPVFWELGINIAKGSWYSKSTRQYSHRALTMSIFIATFEHDRTSIQSRYLLGSLCLVYLASWSKHSLLLIWLTRFVISRKAIYLLPSLSRHNGSAISYICYVHCVIHYQTYDSTWSALFNTFPRGSWNILQEVSFRFLEPWHYSFSRFIRELFISDDELMQVVSQEIRA